MKRTTIVTGALVLALLAGGAWMLRPRPVPVELGTVTRGPLAEGVDAEAKTRVRERYVVQAPFAGRVARMAWREGDRVARGAIVARIDPLPQNAAVAQALAQIEALREQQAGVETLRPKSEAIAQAQAAVAASEASASAARERVAQARAAYEQAQRDERRTSELERSGYESRARVEAARLAVVAAERTLHASDASARAAEAQIRAASAVLAETRAKRSDPEYLKRMYAAEIESIRAQLRELEDRAARTVIRAPVSGTILRVVERSEQVVAAGAPLLEIGDPRRLEIVCDVLSQDAVRMHPGDPIAIVRGADDRHPRARVRTIEPAGYTKISALGIEEQRVNVIGAFLDDPGALGDGYRLEVRITTWSSASVVRVPSSALFRCEDAWCVFVDDAGTARRRIVRIGRQSDAESEVLGGLAPGMRVILRPSDRVTEGTRVR